MSKKAVKQIADKIGDEAISDLCGVGVHSVRNARWRGQFPASWYDALEAVCLKKGVDCPRSAFNFKSPSSDASKGGSPTDGSCLTKDVGSGNAHVKGAA